MSPFITIDDVREDIKDRTAEDHLVLPDVQFTDGDIEWAMRKACRKFNMIKPYSARMSPEAIPAKFQFMFDGIAWALFSRWTTNVLMNDEDYSAGGVSASVQGKLGKNLQILSKDYLEQFVEEATNYKLITNLENAYGQVG